MNSIQLEYFLNIARSGSFTAAARNLHLTQPALSKQIRLLEEELGSLLFIRRPHGIRLTPEGRKLQEEADEIIRRIRNIPAEISELHHTVSGDLNIVCTNFLSRTIMPDLLKRLLEKYPGICPRIRETTARQQPEMLLNGSVDIGLGNLYHLGKHLSCHPIFKSELVLIRSVHSPLAKKKKLTRQDIAGQKLICYPQSSIIYDMVSQIFQPNPPNVFMESQSSATIIELVKENFGIAFVPDYLIEPERRAGIIIGGFHSGMEMTITYHYNPDRALTPQTKAFIEVIRSKFNLQEE